MGGGPVANTPDETQRHQAVRGMILGLFPTGYAMARLPVTVVPSVADLHAIQCVAWILSHYGVDLPGHNWGAPVAEGDCSDGKLGPSRSVPDDGVCVGDFTRAEGPAASEIGALLEFIAACAKRAGFSAAANAQNAAALADVCTTPPFYPVVSPLDLVEASEVIGLALGESVRLKTSSTPTAPVPRPLPPGGLTTPIPAVASFLSVSWIPIIGGMVVVGGLGALAYFSAPRRVKNPDRRRRRR